MDRRIFLSLLPLFLFSIALGASQAPELAPEAFSPAPLFGADVRSLTFVPGHEGVVLAGTSKGHIHRSDDAGQSWRDAGPHIPFPGHVVADLHFDRSQPNRLWAGLWALGQAGSVAFSDDLGKSWTLTAGGGLGGDQVYNLETLEAAPGTIYAGTRSGVYRSSDGGQSWRHLSQEWPVIETVTALHLEPGSPPTIIAGTWRRTYRSDDGGETGFEIFNGRYYDTHIMNLSPVPGEPGRLWASTCGWVYETKDLGSTWRRYRNGFVHRRVHSVLALPGGGLLAGTVAGVHQSRDGETWRRRTEHPVVANVLTFDPTNPARVLAAGEGDGVWTSLDGGQTFRADQGGMINLRVQALGRSDGQLFAAVNYAGSASGIYRLGSGGGHFLQEQSGIPPVQAFREQEGRFYADLGKSLLERREDGWSEIDDNGGQISSRERTPVSPSHRTFDTQHPRFSRISFDRWGLRLHDEERPEESWIRLKLPFPESALAAATFHQDRLYLGSTGYGLWWAPLPSELSESPSAQTGQ